MFIYIMGNILSYVLTKILLYLEISKEWTPNIPSDVTLTIEVHFNIFLHFLSRKSKTINNKLLKDIN